MHISKFSIETKNEILESYYNKKEKISDICKKYHISKSCLYNWIKQFKKYHRRVKKMDINLQQIYALERDLKKLRIENEIFRKSGCGINSSIKEKVEAIEKLKNEYTVHAICRTLNILKSTYYHRLIRTPELKWFEARNETLRPKILELFQQSKERFGAGKITIKLKQTGLTIGRTLVSKLMKEMGLVCKANRLRMYNTTNRYCRYRKNRLRRNFDQDTPNVFWASDMTYILVNKDDHYVCVIIELFSRKVLSFGVSNKNDTELALSTFERAFEDRNRPSGLTFHTDQGSAYTSYKFRKHLRDNKVSQSFSNPGTPYDNAVAEGFFSIMKRDTLSHKWYHSKEDLEADVAEFISYFNEFRPLEKLGNLAPDEYERKYYNKLAAQKEQNMTMELST
jgi:transposase InsO family protein